MGADAEEDLIGSNYVCASAIGSQAFSIIWSLPII